MIIRKIRIENIRGIEFREISVDVHPNTPTFFVAPNGFGKTSIATAFKSIKQSNLDIDEDDKYMNDMSRDSLIQLTDAQGNTYLANSTSNTISQTFSTFVINSQVKPKASSRSFGGFSAASPSLVVDPIILVNTISSTVEFAYSFISMKTFYTSSVGKLLCNLTTMLKSSPFVHSISKNKEALLKLSQQRNAKQISKFIEYVNGFSGTKKDLLSQGIDSSVIEKNVIIPELIGNFSVFFPNSSQLEKIINIIQISKVVKDNQAKLSRIFKYYDYLSEKRTIDEMLNFFNCTWKNIRASQQHGKLVVNFPKANEISNGEREVLCFIAKLFEAKSKLKKEHSILIIDEIFDYLDDANLIAVQYFLTKLIMLYKSEGKELYPIILTHLDPMYFNTYSFSTKNVVYLYDGIGTTNKYKINELLKDRDNCKKFYREQYDNISSHYLHYSPTMSDEHEYLQSLNISKPLLTSNLFHATALEELEKYKSSQDYDIALTCCGLRIYIEKTIYEKLNADQQAEFLSKHKTIDKLSYAKQQGIEVPEVYFLLSIIYNECLHLDSQCKKLKPIACKLKNKVIQNMISEI